MGEDKYIVRFIFRDSSALGRRAHPTPGSGALVGKFADRTGLQGRPGRDGLPFCLRLGEVSDKLGIFQHARPWAHHTVAPTPAPCCGVSPDTARQALSSPQEPDTEQAVRGDRKGDLPLRTQEAPLSSLPSWGGSAPTAAALLSKRHCGPALPHLGRQPSYRNTA